MRPKNRPTMLPKTVDLKNGGKLKLLGEKKVGPGHRVYFAQYAPHKGNSHPTALHTLPGKRVQIDATHFPRKWVVETNIIDWLAQGFSTLLGWSIKSRTSKKKPLEVLHQSGHSQHETKKYFPQKRRKRKA